MEWFDGARIDRTRDVVARHVQRGDVGGVAWLASRHGQVVTGTAGVLTRGRPEPVQRTSLFRIASMTKPIVAAAALALVEDFALRLDDPVDDLLPELADRRVLVDAGGPLDGPTVPAERPITVRDVLTSQLGWGMDLSSGATWPQPFTAAMDQLGLAWGAPEPAAGPGPDEWLRRISTLPLLHQPGRGWRYNTSSDVLGVLVARAAGRPLDQVLADRLFEPLGMSDTGFWTDQLDRLTSCHRRDDDGVHVVHDPPGGQWAAPPPFPSGAGGLLSTVDDLHAFARMLLAGGTTADGSRLLSRASVELMTTDQVGVASGAPGPTDDGSVGWGFGLGVQLRTTDLHRPAGSYGWEGGLGSSWSNDPAQQLAVVVLTTDMFAGPGSPPRAIADVRTGIATAVVGG